VSNPTDLRIPSSPGGGATPEAPIPWVCPRPKWADAAVRLLLMAATSLTTIPALAQDSTTIARPDSSRVAVPDSQQAVSRDAWGIQKNGAAALGEIIGINALVWAFNEYPRGADFTSISPSSYASNVKRGFTWDDNHFTNNFFMHPFHGSLYYNTARSNGFNYWASVPFAFLGSFLWECCGETHPAALNDWVATSWGGAAIGEALYRMSSSVLDNESTGLERFGREVGATALNPVRGFNRIISGRASEVGANPEDPLDRWPRELLNTLYFGARQVNDEGSIEPKGNMTAFFEVNFEYGTPFGERRKPFDYFTFNFVLNARESSALGGLAIRGHIWSTDLSVDEGQHLIGGFAHTYEFLTNNAVNFGGQSIGAFLMTRVLVDERWALRLELGADAYPMSAVNSEFAYKAVVPDTARLREYDMGMGFGGRSGLRVLLNGRTFIDGTFNLVYSKAFNGSVGVLEEFGPIDTWHVIQAFRLGVRVPVFQHFGLGADFQYYRRESNFENDNLSQLVQVVRQARLYLAWEVGRGFTR